MHLHFKNIITNLFWEKCIAYIKMVHNIDYRADIEWLLHMTKMSRTKCPQQKITFHYPSGFQYPEYKIN